MPARSRSPSTSSLRKCQTLTSAPSSWAGQAWMAAAATSSHRQTSLHQQTSPLRMVMDAGVEDKHHVVAATAAAVKDVVVGLPPTRTRRGHHHTTTPQQHTTPTMAADKATTAPRSLDKYVASPAMDHENVGTATPRKSKKNTTLHTPPPTASTQTGTWTVEPLTRSQASWTR
jgi:hypothetical protein